MLALSFKSLTNSFVLTLLLVFLLSIPGGPTYIRRHVRRNQMPMREAPMATLQNFDAEIAKTKQVVEDMRTNIEQSSTVLDTLKADSR